MFVVRSQSERGTAGVYGIVPRPRGSLPRSLRDVWTMVRRAALDPAVPHVMAGPSVDPCSADGAVTSGQVALRCIPGFPDASTVPAGG